MNSIANEVDHLRLTNQRSAFSRAAIFEMPTHKSLNSNEYHQVHDDSDYVASDHHVACRSANQRPATRPLGYLQRGPIRQKSHHWPHNQRVNNIKRDDSVLHTLPVWSPLIIAIFGYPVSVHSLLIRF